MIFDYIKYRIKRQGKYHLHSPYVFDFYVNVIDNLPVLGWRDMIYKRLADFRKPVCVLVESTIMSLDSLNYALKICNDNNAKVYIDLDGMVLKSDVDETFDFVYINGMMGKTRVKDVARHVLKHCNEKTVIMFEKPYFRKINKRMWNSLIDNPSVTLSIDCYRFGFAFMLKRYEKQHFILKS